MGHFMETVKFSFVDDDDEDDDDDDGDPAACWDGGEDGGIKNTWFEVSTFLIENVLLSVQNTASNDVVDPTIVRSEPFS